jgi:hypothetical protein
MSAAYVVLRGGQTLPQQELLLPAKAETESVERVR